MRFAAAVARSDSTPMAVEISARMNAMIVAEIGVDATNRVDGVSARQPLPAQRSIDRPPRFLALTARLHGRAGGSSARESVSPEPESAANSAGAMKRSCLKASTRPLLLLLRRNARNRREVVRAGFTGRASAPQRLEERSHFPAAWSWGDSSTPSARILSREWRQICRKLTRNDRSMGSRRYRSAERWPVTMSTSAGMPGDSSISGAILAIASRSTTTLAS